MLGGSVGGDSQTALEREPGEECQLDEEEAEGGEGAGEVVSSPWNETSEAMLMIFPRGSPSFRVSSMCLPTSLEQSFKRQGKGSVYDPRPRWTELEPNSIGQNRVRRLSSSPPVQALTPILSPVCVLT